MPQPTFLSASFYVALGGGIGAWLRFVVGRCYVAWLGPVRASAFPWGTLTVNLLGSLAMGLLAGWLARHGSATESLRLFLAVGVLGGFTTFSAFSLELVLLAQRGQIGLAALYAALSLGAGVAGLLLGLALMRQTA
jgi:CrcB protein